LLSKGFNRFKCPTSDVGPINQTFVGIGIENENLEPCPYQIQISMGAS
jgi:hypothetical protein